MNRIFTSIILILFFTGGISSCSVFRHGRKKHSSDSAAVNTLSPKDTSAVVRASVDTAKPVQPTNINTALITQLTPLWNRQLAFTTFSGKAKMSLEGKDLTANFRIKKDSVIWVTITAFGGVVQVARVYITPDSLFMVNYIDKYITRMPLSQARQMLPAPVDFNTLQSLIIGAPLSHGALINVFDLGTSWALQTKDTAYEQQVTYSKADSSLMAGSFHTANNAIQGNTQYTDYTKEDNINFSQTRVLDLQNADEHYHLDMEFVNFEFNKPVDFPFNIPKNYTVK